VVELAASRDVRADGSGAPRGSVSVLDSYSMRGVTLPPQETGLTVNSWYGKFHLEMHWWHGSHFALWNRLPLFERVWAGTNRFCLPRERGHIHKDMPVRVGPRWWGRKAGTAHRDWAAADLATATPDFLCRTLPPTRKDRKTLERYGQIVFESAEFMASYAFLIRPNDDTSWTAIDSGPGRIIHHARPGIQPSSWLIGLKDWILHSAGAKRLGLKRQPQWDRVICDLSSLPVRDGVYLAHENCRKPIRAQSRSPFNAGSLGMYAVMELIGSDAPHFGEGSEGMALGSNVGLGLSAHCDDRGAFGRTPV